MEPHYCVRPLSVVSERESAELERKLSPRLPFPIEPYLFQSWKSANYPLVTRAYSVKRVDGLDAGRNLFWSFSVDYRLVGPRTYGFSVSVEDGSVAVDRSGQSLLIGSTEDEPAKVFPRQRLVRQVDEGAITQVDQELQTQIDEPRFTAWSDVLDGFVVGSTKWRPPTDGGARVGDERVFIVRNDSAVSLPGVEVYLKIVADLPGLGATGLLGSRVLVLVTPQLEATKVAQLNPGDDYGGFRALHETRDEGWLYVVGDQYDNAVHVEKADGQWRVTSIVRIAEDDGWINGLLRWALGMNRRQAKRDGLSAIVRAGPCRRFSTAVKRMFFCDNSGMWTDVRSELRAGNLVPIAGGVAGLKTFLGDADSLGLALFLGNDRGLYGYDGERVHRLADADFDRAVIHDVRQLKRTFLESQKDVFEVRAKGAGFELVKLETPVGADGFFANPIIATPDGAVVVFGSREVYLVEDNALTAIWSSKQYGFIETSGLRPPTEVNGWSGILFVTHAGNERRFHLLRRCSGFSH
jgi:hypothetical protein